MCDKEDTYAYCIGCHTSLMFRNNAWKIKPDKDHRDWYANGSNGFMHRGVMNRRY